MIAIVTVCSRAYLAQALTMLLSVGRFEGNYIYNVFLTDLTSKDRGWLNDLHPNIEFYFLDEYGTPEILDNLLLLTDLEFNTALKPVALEIAIERFSLKTFYCDSDLLFLAPITDAVNQLNSCDILLTPHQLGYVSHKDDFAMARTGIFNSGFLGVSGLRGLSFVKWWKEKTQNFCFLEPEDGVFVDQKWLDLVPALFQNSQIYRNAGYNVGYWNLEQIKDVDQIIILHLSGFGLNRKPAASDLFSKHSDRKIPPYLLDKLNLYWCDYKKNVSSIKDYFVKNDASDLIGLSEKKIPTIEHRYLATRYNFIVKGKNLLLVPKTKKQKYQFVRLYRKESGILYITRRLGAIFVKLGMSYLLEIFINIFRLLGRRNSWLL